MNLYLARLVPIGEPATVHGDGGQPVTFTFDKFHFSDTRSILRNGGDMPVLVGHDDTMRIGTVRSLSPNRSWWVVDFELDEALGVEFDVGQNVSIGLGWRLNDAGNPRVNEVSVVRRGRVPGAEIINRQEVKRRVPSAKTTAKSGAYEIAGYSMTYDHDGHLIERRPAQTITRQCGQILAVGGVPVGRSAKDSLPDDGYSTLYDHNGNVIERYR